MKVEAEPRQRPPWWLLLGAATYLIYAGMLTYALLLGPERLGTDNTFDELGLIVAGVVSGSPAERAGLAEGDRLLAVEDRPIRNATVWMLIRAELEIGRPYRLVVDRAGRRLETTVTLGRTSWKRFGSLEEAVRLVSFMGLRIPLVLALLIALSRPGDPTAWIGSWVLATVGTAVEAPPYGSAALWRSLPPPVALLLWFPFLSGFALGPLLLTFFAVFPRRLIRSRAAWALIWTPLILGLLWLSPTLWRVAVTRQIEPADQDRVRLFMPVPVGYVLAAVGVLLVSYRRLNDVNERRRLRVLVIGAAVGLLAPVPHVVTEWARLPRMEEGPAWAQLGLLLTLAFPFAFAYALLRHRLFDVRLMVRQGLRYALARRALLSMVPALAGLLVLDLLLHGDQPLRRVLEARGWIYASLGALTLLAQTRRESWLTALDRRFFRERYDAQRLLQGVVEEVRGARDVNEVAARVVGVIEAALHPRFAALLQRSAHEAMFRTLAVAPADCAPLEWPVETKLVGLARLLGRPLEVSATDPGGLARQLPPVEVERLRQTGVDLVVPIVLDPAGAEALIVLGSKRSEEPFSREDHDLLSAVAASLGLLMERPAAPAAERAGPPTLAGRYRLGRELGRGGMGAVHEATDTVLGRRVAVKLVREDLLGSPSAAERFRNEAQAAAAFAHPNVVTIHDFGVDTSGRAYLVMERLEGRDLRTELRDRKRLAPARTLTILRQVCAAVEAAHRRRLVHRDLKPENVFLAQLESGEVAKVLDFGVAKFVPEAAGASAETATRGLVGTPRYMAPEQLAGGPAQPSWDVWALGVMSYEMLTGTHPFEAAGAEWPAAVLVGRFAPVAASLVGAPPAWQEFFTLALAAGAERRPSGAQAFLEALAPVLA